MKKEAIAIAIIKSWSERSRGGGRVIEITLAEGQKEKVPIPISPNGWMSAWVTEGEESDFSWTFLNIQDLVSEVAWTLDATQKRYTPTETAYLKFTNSGTKKITFRFSYEKE